MTTINTYQGHLVNPFSEFEVPPVETFCHSLSLLNRYTGHTFRPYSVAEHTVYLARCPQVKKAGLVRAAILHDFNEALTNDLPYPFKSRLTEFEKMEASVQRKIFKHFNEPWGNMLALDEFDKRLAVDEMMQLMIAPPLPWAEPMGVKITDDQPWHYWRSELKLLAYENGVS